MKFLVGLVIGAIIAAAIGAGAIAVALGEIDEVDVANRDKSGDVSQTFELRDFDKIDVAGVYELEVMVGEDYSVVISGPSEEMERVQAKVEDGSLVLDQTKQQKRGIGVLHKEGVTAKVSLPSGARTREKISGRYGFRLAAANGPSSPISPRLIASKVT